MLRSLHSRSEAEADTEEAVEVVFMEAVAEADSTVAAVEGVDSTVEAADSMEAAVTAERIAAEAADFTAAVAVRTAADLRVAPREELMDTAGAAGTRRADTAAVPTAHMAGRDRMARTAAARQEIRRALGTVRHQVRGVRIR